MVGAPLMYWQHRSVPRKLYTCIFLHEIQDGRRSFGGFCHTLLLFCPLRPLRLRPGVVSIIWESLVLMHCCSREDFANNRSTQLFFIYIDIKRQIASICQGLDLIPPR